MRKLNEKTKLVNIYKEEKLRYQKVHKYSRMVFEDTRKVNRDTKKVSRVNIEWEIKLPLPSKCLVRPISL